MSHLLAIGVGFWIAGIGLLGFVAVTLVRRSLMREFPVFSFYIFYHFIQAILGLWVYAHYSGHVYWVVHWSSEAFDGPLTLALVYEIFSKAFRPYPGIRTVGLKLFLSAAVILLVAAAWTGLAHPGMASVNAAVVIMNRSIESMRLVLLLVLFVFHRLVGLNWRHYTFGLALGLCVATIIATVNTTIRVYLGLQSPTLFYLIYVIMAPLSYDLGVAVWAYYCATAESKLTVSEIPYSPQLSRWNTALEQLLAG